MQAPVVELDGSETVERVGGHGTWERLEPGPSREYMLGHEMQQDGPVLEGRSSEDCYMTEEEVAVPENGNNTGLDSASAEEEELDIQPHIVPLRYRSASRAY